MKHTSLILLFLLSLASLTACESLWSGAKTTVPTPVLQAVPVADMFRLGDDELHKGLAAFGTSCPRILKAEPTKNFGDGAQWGQYDDWQKICADLKDAPPLAHEAAKDFIAAHFNVFSLKDGATDTGLLTGYYEPTLAASTQKNAQYQIPIRARPADLVMVNLGDFKPEFKGQRIAGSVKDGYLKPYADRAAIEDGKLPKTVDVPLYWAKDAVDVFFLQIQGSGMLTLPTGDTLRIGYDGQNGHPYTAIGRELIKRGALTKDNVSMDSIRAWLAAHPAEGKDVMRINQSYVFFRKLDTSGPVGAEGVVLTPERSMAVDHKYLPYGLPLFITADTPQMARLMVAQDTGGAIQGVLRGDVFWGAGENAAATAGPMKAKGQFWVLLPKDIK